MSIVEDFENKAKEEASKLFPLPDDVVEAPREINTSDKGLIAFIQEIKQRAYIMGKMSALKDKMG